MPGPTDPKLWKPRRRIEQSYASEMYDLIGQQFLPAFLRRGLPWTAPGSLDFDIETIALSIARRMVRAVSVANAHSWRQAALQSGRGQVIYRALQEEMQGRVGQEVRKLIAENARLIQSIPEDLRVSTARFIAAQQRKGIRSETIAKELRVRLPQLAESKIHLIARTETAKAETSFSQVRAENLGIRWYEWQTSEDQRVRKSHQKMNEVLVAWANPPSPEALVHEKSTLGHYAPGGCPNCFPGDTPVHAPSGIERVWRAPYTGDLIGIWVDGSVLWGTPNHPILTRHGWRPLHELQIGDDVIQARHDGSTSAEAHSYESQATLDEVFAATVRHGHAESAFGLNFHGDVINEHIDDIAIHGSLQFVGDSGRGERFRYLPLAGSDSFVPESSFCGTLEIAGSAFSSSFDEFSALIRSEFLHADGIGLTAASEWHASLAHDALYGYPAGSEMIGDAHEAPLLFDIEVDNFGGRYVGATIGSNPSLSRQHDASGAQMFAQVVGRDAHDFRSSSEGFPGPHKIGRVLDKRVRHFSGHVFTMQTGDGWYGASSANIVTQNCRCVAIPLVRLDEVSWPHRCYVNSSIVWLTRAEFTRISGLPQIKRAA